MHPPNETCSSGGSVGAIKGVVNWPEDVALGLTCQFRLRSKEGVRCAATGFLLGNRATVTGTLVARPLAVTPGLLAGTNTVVGVYEPGQGDCCWLHCNELASRMYGGGTVNDAVKLP